MRLLSLLESEEGAAAVAVSAAVPQLVQLLDTPILECEAASALVNLSAFGTSAATVAAAGGVPALLSLLRRSTGRQGERGAELAMAALVNLATHHSDGAAAVAAEGGMPLVLSMLGTTQGWGILQPHSCVMLPLTILACWTPAPLPQPRQAWSASALSDWTLMRSWALQSRQ